MEGRSHRVLTGFLEVPRLYQGSSEYVGTQQGFTRRIIPPLPAPSNKKPAAEATGLLREYQSRFPNGQSEEAAFYRSGGVVGRSGLRFGLRERGLDFLA